jgi:hypothetical protein
VPKNNPYVQLVEVFSPDKKVIGSRKDYTDILNQNAKLGKPETIACGDSKQLRLRWTDGSEARIYYN